MDTLEPRMESLLMRKTFAELNAEERIFVAASLTEESYTAYHLILKHTMSDTSDEALVPSAAIPAKLKAHFDAARRPSLRVSLSAKHLSLAACLFVALCLGVVFFKAGPSARPELKPGHVKVELPKSKDELKKKSINLPEQAVLQKLVSHTKIARRVKPGPKAKLPVQAGLLEKKDSIPVVPEKFYGLRVQEPLLGLDIDVNDQLLGLRIPVVNL